MSNREPHTFEQASSEIARRANAMSMKIANALDREDNPDSNMASGPFYRPGIAVGAFTTAMNSFDLNVGTAFAKAHADKYDGVAGLEAQLQAYRVLSETFLARTPEFKASHQGSHMFASGRIKQEEADVRAFNTTLARFETEYHDKIRQAKQGPELPSVKPIVVAALATLTAAA